MGREWEGKEGVVRRGEGGRERERGEGREEREEGGRGERKGLRETEG